MADKCTIRLSPGIDVEYYCAPVAFKHEQKCEFSGGSLGSKVKSYLMKHDEVHPPAFDVAVDPCDFLDKHLDQLKRINMLSSGLNEMVDRQDVYKVAIDRGEKHAEAISTFHGGFGTTHEPGLPMSTCSSTIGKMNGIANDLGFSIVPKSVEAPELAQVRLVASVVEMNPARGQIATSEIKAGDLDGACVSVIDARKSREAGMSSKDFALTTFLFGI